MGVLEQARYKRNERLFSWFEDILNQCGQDIQYAMVKGDILSKLAYGTVNCRPYNDIDIIVPRNRLKELDLILKDCGYLQKKHSREIDVFLLSASHQVLPYYNPKTQLVIDVNFDIFWGEYEGERIDINDFLNDTIVVDCYGVYVKTLPVIKSFIQLVLHHYKDMNSIYLISTRKSIKYSMFKEVYFLWKNNIEEITLERLHSICEKYKITPYVFYVLYYTNAIFNDNCLKTYVDSLRTSEGEELLNCYGLCSKERKEWKCNFIDRLESANLFDTIKEDLTSEDLSKITINKQVFEML